MNDIAFLYTKNTNSYVVIDANLLMLCLQHAETWSNVRNYAIGCSKLLRKPKGGGVRIFLHRLILDVENKKKRLAVDHINGCCFDNRKCNLRLVTNSQNEIAKKKRTLKTESKYLGVVLNKQSNRWYGQCKKDGKKYHAGTFETQEQAALAVNKLRQHLHGSVARMNEVACA